MEDVEMQLQGAFPLQPALTIVMKSAGATEPEQGKNAAREALENTNQGNMSDSRAGSQKPATEIANEKSSKWEILYTTLHLGKYATQVYGISTVSSFICVIIWSVIFTAKAYYYTNISSFCC